MKQGLVFAAGVAAGIVLLLGGQWIWTTFAYPGQLLAVVAIAGFMVAGVFGLYSRQTDVAFSFVGRVAFLSVGLALVFPAMMLVLFLLRLAFSA